MDQDTMTKIENSIRRLENLRQTNQEFLDHLKSHKKAERIQAELDVAENVITVPCFGYVVSAEPRPVATNDGFSLFEYAFLVQDLEEEIELWRFYLGRDGRLRSGLDENTYLCDMNNTLIADHICTHILQRALESKLLAPRHGRNG